MKLFSDLDEINFVSRRFDGMLNTKLTGGSCVCLGGNSIRFSRLPEMRAHSIWGDVSGFANTIRISFRLCC